MGSDEVEGFLAGLPQALAPIETYFRSKAESGVWADKQSGALMAGHRPDKGAAAFDAIVFPPAPAMSRVAEPPPLSGLYKALNGGFFGRLSIFGRVGKFSRTMRNPLDSAMAEVWKANYAPCSSDCSLFASENVSETGQVGYFVSGAGEITGRGKLKSSAPAEAGRWETIAEWLEDRLPVDGGDPTGF